ncbi:hypothetical protein CRE_20190 [Caenorhabditis remanei]|uniref:Uncharacterized protein n=1 Tax=Caenorhabditis remanei TaxID=31234 RepID=E3MCK0_CAERE|nr:hypothetical protein CRE_20190 [Caenorhabditis remanei]
MELQRKRSFNSSTVSHDFRKEYKGSFLEKKGRKEGKKNGLKSIAEWIMTKASSTKKTNSSGTSATSTNSASHKSVVGAKIVTVQEKSSYFDCVPNEILFQILENCKSSESSTTLSARRVSRRFNACMDHISEVKVNVNFVESESNIGHHTCFKQFVFQNVPLSDELIDFLRRLFQFADISKLIQLSLSQVDFSSCNSLSLHRFLAPLIKSLEIFEITQCNGMRADSVTDEHLAQLNASTIRRICIDGVKFASGATRNLDIGDGALRRFAKLAAFPTMILDRCAVTTNTVCDYTKEWFEQCNESEKQLRSQVCTVKRCPKVKGSQFESECRRRGLRCKNRRGSGSLTLYNVQEENTKREFTIALAALEDKELAEKLKITPPDDPISCNLLTVPSL